MVPPLAIAIEPGGRDQGASPCPKAAATEVLPAELKNDLVALLQ